MTLQFLHKKIYIVQELLQLQLYVLFVYKSNYFTMERNNRIYVLDDVLDSWFVLVDHKCQIKWLQCVFRDKIRSETKLVRDKNQSEKKIFCQKKFCCKKLSWSKDVVSDFQCAKWVVSNKSMLIITKRFFHTTTKCSIWQVLVSRKQRRQTDSS